MTDTALINRPKSPAIKRDAVDDVLRETAIVILTWNQREATRRCLQSIAAAGYSLGRVVLWDNGSVDGTDDAIIDEFPDVIFHRHPHNQGVASGRNSAALLAMRKVSPTHLLFLDNDMVVTSGFLESLCEPFVADSRQAQAVAKIRILNDPERLHAAGGQDVNFALGIKNSIGYGEMDCGQYDDRQSCLPSGGATLVAVKAFLELDGFDSVFDPFGAEDLDFAFRVRRANYQATYVPEAIVYHDYHRKNGAGQNGDLYVAARVKHWLILLRRHASIGQKLGFFLGGAVVGLSRIVRRQVLIGNVPGLSGLARGVVSYLGSRPRKEISPPGMSRRRN